MPGMRDIFTDMFDQQPADPVEAARRAVRTRLRRRFYRTAGIVEVPGKAFSVTLDDHPIRTPGGASLVFPSRQLADAVVAEWRAQREVVDPAGMPLTRLSNTVVDGVAHATVQVGEEILRYLRSDLLFYRAEAPAGLVARQAEHWDPILAWAHDVHGARFMLVQGVNFISQPESAIAAVAVLIPSDAWRLGAVHVVTTLTGSALIALAVATGQISAEAAWTAAHVDEDWNMRIWGRDELALQRRAFREAEMRAAANVLAWLSGG